MASNGPDGPEDEVLDPGQEAIIAEIRKRGLELCAETYAYMGFLREIETLSAEELASIPSFLLDPYLAEQEEASYSEE